MSQPNNFFTTVKNESITNRIIMLILLSYPALLLTVRSSMGILFGLLLIISAVQLYRMRKSLATSHWDKNSIAFSLAMASPIVAIFLSEAYHGDFHSPSYDWASRFLLAIPIFLALRRTNIRTITVLQFGMPIGALVGLSMLILHPFDWGGRYTTSSFFNLIHFSDTALMLGFLSLFSINWERKDHPLILTLKLCGFFAGFYMSIQSGERGGWVAIPLLLLLWIAAHSGKRFWLHLSLSIPIVIAAIWLSYSMLDIVHSRIDAIFSDIQNFAHGNKDTSIGIRFQHWQVALHLFFEHPFFGVGPEGFARAIPELQSNGMLTPTAARLGYSEVHNEILAKCASTGLFGLFSILSVYLVPLFIFWRSSKSAESNSKIAAFMGICLVSGFFVFGLTVEIFDLRMTAAFFSFTLAVLMAAATHQGHEGKSSRPDCNKASDSHHADDGIAPSETNRSKVRGYAISKTIRLIQWCLTCKDAVQSRFTPPPVQEHNFHPTYRPDIDGLRAVAILAVVIYHAFPANLRGGFVGVDIFFVISGFLISNIIFKSLQHGVFSFTEFYAHRIKRIFPALILVLAVSFTFGWFALMPDEFKQLGKHIAAGAGFVQNFILWKEAGYFDTASELKPLMHLWSLAIEEQFYLVYPLLVWGAWRLGPSTAFAIIVLLGLLSFGLNVHGIKNDAIKTFFFPQTRFWELLVGAALAYLQLFKRAQFADWLKRCLFHPVIFRRFPPGLKRDAALDNFLSIFGFLLIAASVIALNKGTPFPGWWALPPVFGAFLLILAGAEAWVNRRILASRLMIFIGLISYPLYLWHWPVLSFTRIVTSEPPSGAIRLGAVGLSLLLAWLTYQLLEKPIRFGGKTWLKTAVLCVLTTTVGLVGYNTLERNGLGFRITTPLSGLEQFHWSKKMYREDSCIAANPISTERIVFCVGDVRTASVFLTGDSHSNALYPGLAEIYPGKILNIAQSDCLPFFDIDAGITKQSPHCPHEDVNAFLRIAENNPQIKTIIIASRGPLYIEGTGFGPAESDNLNRYIKWKDSLDEGRYAEVFEQSMRATLQRFLLEDKQIIFVLDVPELGFGPELCVDTAPLRLSRVSGKPCAVPRAEYDKRNKKYREIVFSVLKDFPSVKVFDPAVLLCDTQYCWAMKEGKMLYRDDDHLSVEGSRFIARELAKVLQSLPK